MFFILSCLFEKMACNLILLIRTNKRSTMKRILYLIIILPLLLSSCEMIPEALFYVDKLEPFVGEEVFFTNQSFNAVSFEWNFGDGTYSNAVDPVHVYTGSGSFQVELKAFSESGLSANAYQTIDVRIPTLLEIEVLEYYDKYPVKNASVILYPTLSDWDNEKNAINEGFTDADGKVIFSGLGRKVYYADIWEAHHNNYTLRNEDVAFIRIPEIIPNQINRFVAYVDYVEGTKSDGKRDRTMVIKSIGRKWQPVE
jgi:hypothetical protein